MAADTVGAKLIASLASLRASQVPWRRPAFAKKYISLLNYQGLSRFAS